MPNLFPQFLATTKHFQNLDQNGLSTIAYFAGFTATAFFYFGCTKSWYGRAVVPSLFLRPWSTLMYMVYKRVPRAVEQASNSKAALHSNLHKVKTN